ncbi:hypothetical protein SAMN04515692_11631 [Leifsonia sp. CL147]|nr:hypothetical protein SAMN04515694_11646 [Leifsonia sp. CL154]SFL89159.1 hypothetical protein SAMN04515692_11631 [Leifsonia sp. CL147]
MRSSRSSAGLLIVVAVVCFSLVGCTGLFTKSIGWVGGTFWNERKHIQKDIEGMTLRLFPDGTGSAHGLPRGHQKTANNICIEVTSEDRYSGDVTWQEVNDHQFEISFPGSKYTVANATGKFVPDWAEVRIYTCNWGGEYWSLKSAD